MTDPGVRRAELSASLQAVEARIVNACAAAGRARNEVTLVVVTKYFPVSDVLHLHDLGVADIGENRDQEALDKVREIRQALGVAAAPRVHFVGQLQTNKAGRVSSYADVVHSVDRPKLVTALSRGAADAGRRLDILLQVSLDGDTSRGGVAAPDVLALADAVAAAPALRLKGVMAVAPLGADPDASFASLWEVASGIRAGHPMATWVSAGMSGDLEAALRHGATHLRVGTAILGSRPSLL